MDELFDFHLHPFLDTINSIARYGHPADWKEFLGNLKRHGITQCAGSVIHKIDGSDFGEIRKMNDEALRLRDLAPAGFYHPGVHIHPNFPDESCKELDRVHAEGVRLIGELVPYLMGYTEYSCDALAPVWKHAAELSMVVSIHTGAIADMTAFATANPTLNIVIAHPGEHPNYMEKLELCKRCPNVYLDLCGTGLFRNWMLEYGVGLIGAERFLFATDYPTCNIGMQIGALQFAEITAEQRSLICSGNAKRLLKL